LPPLQGKEGVPMTFVEALGLLLGLAKLAVAIISMRKKK
jgi:hypothetical protein